MNLIEESFQTKEEKKKQKATKIVLGAIIFVVLIMVAIMGYLMYIKSTTLTLTLDGAANEDLKNILLIQEDGNIYVPIKEFAKYMGYESYNGEYKGQIEEMSKCYAINNNEVVNFSLGSNKLYKLDLTVSNDKYDYVYTKNPIKAVDGDLCADIETLQKAFNISFQYEKEKNSITIYTMPYLVQWYNTKVLDYGYNEVSNVFANQKLVLENMLIVNKNGKHGVIDVEGNVILEPKYENILYLPYIGDFLVKSNGKVGIMSKNNETKIQIMYDNIEVMDVDTGLYVVRKDNKYGVIDSKGNIKIHIENNEIGMNISRFEQNDIKNKYILVDNLIPVRKDNLWGLYDKTGNQVVEFKYNSFGYIASSNKNAMNLLVIPDYNVLVACKDGKYTLLNSVGQELFVAPVADDIYMTIDGGEKHYYITANNGIMDAEEYLDKIGVLSIKENEEMNNNTNNNSVNEINNNDNNINNTEENENIQENNPENVENTNNQQEDNEQNEVNTNN